MFISEGNCPIPETLIYDVSRSSGSLQGRLTNSTCMWMPLLFVHQALQKSNVTLMFDRYFPNSTKNVTKKPGTQADTGDACSSQTSHSHQYEEQDSIECHARRRPAQRRLLPECNTEVYYHNCWCQRRASGDSWWCTD